jgi:hypothetical protein
VAVLRVLALIATVLGATACTGRDVRGPFRTQFVDAKTGKPIEGVVFLAVWHSITPNLVGDGGEEFYEAREVVSGPDGRVEAPALVGPIWRLALDVRFHEIARDGYATSLVQVTPAEGRRYIDPTITRMRQLRTREERCSRLSFLMPSVPRNTTTIPLFLAMWEAELGAACPEKG